MTPEVVMDTTQGTAEPSQAVLAPRGPFQPQAITRSADHVYMYQGKRYPGVTGILNTVLDKSYPLKKWAANQTADAVLGLVKAGENGTWDFGSLDALFKAVGPGGVKKAITDRSNWTMDKARDLGTEVHDLADQWIRGLNPTIPKHAAKHVEHYGEWWKASGWTLRTSEAMVLHPTFGYGGTLDLLCYDRDRKTVLADIKTGNVYQSAVLQLTAYGLAELIQTEAGVFTMPTVDRHVILHVTADGVREIEVPVGTLEKVAWGACMDLHQWAETTKGKRL